MSNAPESPNPFAPLAETSTTAPPGGTEAESIRNHYLSHEASVKSIGILYLLGGVLGVLVGIGYCIGGVVALTSGGEGATAGVFIIVAGLVVLGISVGQFLVGSGIRKLVPWARIAGVVFSCIGLLGFPIGTLISAYFLYLLLSKKGEYVFSDGYKRVMADTPHIKYKTPIVVWILVGLLVLLLLFVVVAAFVGASAR